MIERIKGKLIYRQQNRLIVDCHDMGYGIEVPYSVLTDLGEDINQEIVLWIFTHLREDSLRLFGFSTFQDRELFSILIALSGVGPKMALAILSTYTLTQIAIAVKQEKSELFETVPGIGKRTAEKLLVELKPKLEKLENLLHRPGALFKPQIGTEMPSAPSAYSLGLERSQEIYSALDNLGFKEKMTKSTVEWVLKNHPDLDFSRMIQMILGKLTSGKINVEKPHFEKEEKKSGDLLGTF